MRDANMHRILRTAAALLLGLTCAAAGAREIQSVESIRAAVERFALAGVAHGPGELHAEVGYLDSRLRLARCAQELDLSVPGGRPPALGNVTVGVRCGGPSPWSLYVPVKIQAHDEVVVLAQPAARGDVITAEMLRIETREVTDLVGEYYARPEQVIGKRAGQTLPPGRILDRLSLSAPLVLERGDRIILVAGNGSFEVRMSGRALADGAVGERVRVENLSSERVVEGTVTADGHVRVGL